MEITEEILDKYSFSLYEDITGYEKRTYKAMFEKVSTEILDKYNLKLATIWEFYKIPKEEIKNIHPIAFFMNIKRIHFLPFYVFENMSLEQILILSKPHLKRLPISTLENWLKKYNDEDINIEVLDDMRVPYNSKLIHFQKNLSGYIDEFKEDEWEMSKVKPEFFYLETNCIGLNDMDRFLFQSHPKYVSVEIHNLFKEFLLEGQTEVFDYNRVLEYLNSLYWYRDLNQIERMYSLGEVGALYAQTLYSKDIEVLKYASYLLETDDNIPKIQFSKKVFKYFYKDVVEYIEGRLYDKFNKNK